MNLSDGMWRPPQSRRPASRSRSGLKVLASEIFGFSVAVAISLFFQVGGAAAQVNPVTDPTAEFSRIFGLGGHSCKQYDDTGRLFIYSEGIPSQGIISWLQRSDAGTRANVPMPEELAAALPLIPGCLPGKHHA